MKKILRVTACLALMGMIMFSCEEDAATPCMDQVWYKDSDGDGKGDSKYYLYSCNVQPEGFVSDNTDNDDTLPCDVASTFYRDKDGDGKGDPNDTILACEAPEGYVDNGDDDVD